MAAPVRSTITVLAPTLVNPVANSNEGTPAFVGPWVDISAKNGGDFGWSVKNGASAPGVQGQFTIQVSDRNDGLNMVNLYSAGGNTVPGTSTTANPESSGVVDCPNTVKYVRMLCYGHTTNAVTFSLSLFAKD